MRAFGKAYSPVDAQQPAGVVEVQVRQRHVVDRIGIEAGRAQRRQDRLPPDASLLLVVVVHPFADTGLDEHPTRGRLHQQAVERLRQRVVGVDLVGHQALPHQPRDRSQDGAGIAGEDAGLDECDGRAAAEVIAPVGARIDGHL